MGMTIKIWQEGQLFGDVIALYRDFGGDYINLHMWQSGTELYTHIEPVSVSEKVRADLKNCLDYLECNMEQHKGENMKNSVQNMEDRMRRSDII